MDNDDWKFAAILVAIIAGVFLFGISIAVGFEYWSYKNMQELGYNTQFVNGSCYAKFKERWLDCSAVSRNQVQVVGE